ncbi:PH domain-containing protein [Robertmurraya korlensis]|uniref:PH domain-containing protein n=1 Tax=Robertmurraya korlensis TaxID=519977 RepID=UPI00203BA450|nr:PH domain-containing protein [Robertmurraya korlensis]MCM3602168.1 PH domain-containing protein [Robertmurraya korlensis]
MFKKIAADALGLSDIGKIIDPRDFDKTDADDYVMHEDNEKIYFLIKTKADEYCFTNLALIHVDGQSAASSKRTLYRYPYSQHKISNVTLETAGKLDMDVEIKFRLGDVQFDIDVQKDQMEKLKDLYKALLRISETTYENSVVTSLANESLEKAVAILQNSRTEELKLSQQYKELTEFGFNWLTSIREQYHEKDFGDVFEKYINN